MTEKSDFRFSLEDLWKSVFLTQTEWDNMDLVHQYNWIFSHFEKTVEELAFEEDGKNVYLFGTTENQCHIKIGEGFVRVPVMFAVVSPCPPSDMVARRTFKMASDEIIPIKQMNLDWVPIPYIPQEYRIWESDVDRLEPRIFILSCTQNRESLNSEKAKKLTQCVPYIYQPPTENELSTFVDVFYPPEAPTVYCEIDWEVDEIEEVTNKFIKKGKISEREKDAFKDFVSEKVMEARRRKEEILAIEESRGKEAKKAYNNMRFYKFYPVLTAYTPYVSKGPHINIYFGNAHKVL